MRRSAAGEAPQHLLGLRRPQAQGGGVLDHLAVLLGDQVPLDGPGRQRAAERGPAGRGAVGPVHADAADVLQPGQQTEVQQLGEREPDHGRYVDKSSILAVVVPGRHAPAAGSEVEDHRGGGEGREGVGEAPRGVGGREPDGHGAVGLGGSDGADPVAVGFQEGGCEGRIGLGNGKSLGVVIEQ
nr:hypothetical protein [Salinispora tropica]